MPSGEHERLEKIRLDFIRENKVRASGPRSRSHSVKVVKLRWRDGDTCWLCGKEITIWKCTKNKRHPLLATLDHVRPKKHGGTNGLHNLKLAHYICNSKRGSHFVVEPHA